MDEASIPITLNNDRRQKPKDERVLHQQRSCILNGEAVINHYNIYIQKKQDLALKRLQSGRAVKRDQKHSNEGPSVCPSPKNQPKKRSSRKRKPPLANISQDNIADNFEGEIEDEMIYL